jgi:hypothetical protein
MRLKSLLLYALRQVCVTALGGCHEASNNAADHPVTSNIFRFWTQIKPQDRIHPAYREMFARLGKLGAHARPAESPRQLW